MAQACLLHTLVKSRDMEKKMFGIILTVLGIVGLIAAAVNFVNSKNGSANVKLIVTYSILGAVFFFAGIGLIKGTKDTSDTNRPS